jgi:hypothetical protein
MIVEEFGGSFGLKSELEVGSRFTFVVALEKLTNTQNKINRIRNPKSRSINKFNL